MLWMVLALDQLQTSLLAGAILAIILTLCVVGWMEASIRLRRGKVSDQTTPGQKPQNVDDVQAQVSQYLAYGSWIPIYRVAAVVVIAGSAIVIVVALVL